MTILVVGLGNILLRDEGIGVRVIEALQHRGDLPAGIELVDGGTSAMDLLDTLAQAEHLIIIDAVRGGRAPGSLVRIAGDAVPAFFQTKLSPHQVGLSDVLATLRLMEQEPKTVVVLGCEPETLETGLELSPTVAAQVDPLCRMALTEVAALVAGAG